MQPHLTLNTWGQQQEPLRHGKRVVCACRPGRAGGGADVGAPSSHREACVLRAPADWAAGSPPRPRALPWQKGFPFCLQCATRQRLPPARFHPQTPGLHLEQLCLPVPMELTQCSFTERLASITLQLQAPAGRLPGDLGALDRVACFLTLDTQGCL